MLNKGKHIREQQSDAKIDHHNNSKDNNNCIFSASPLDTQNSNNTCCQSLYRKATAVGSLPRPATNHERRFKSRTIRPVCQLPTLMNVLRWYKKTEFGNWSNCCDVQAETHVDAPILFPPQRQGNHMTPSNDCGVDAQGTVHTVADLSQILQTCSKRAQPTFCFWIILVGTTASTSAAHLQLSNMYTYKQAAKKS